MSNKKRKIYVLIIIIFVFNFIYILNDKTTLVLDDYSYHFTFSRVPNEHTKLITNPIEIFGSMANHWKTWGGRVSIHFLLQLVFMFKISIFNIINSIMFILLGTLIYKHINKPSKYKILWLILIYETIFLFAPQPSHTFLWKSGSANYLWSSVLLLCMTLVYKKYYDDKNNIKDNYLNMILLFLFGLIVGNTNENMGCALIVIEIFFMLFYKTKYKKIPKWAFSSLISTSLGYIFLLTSPGNYLRAKYLYPNINYSFASIIKCIFKLSILSFKYLSIIIIAVIISYLFLCKRKKTLYSENNKIQIIYLIFSGISIYSLVLSPIHPDRCWMFAFVYLTIIIGLNLKQLLKKNYFTIVLVCLLSFITINEYSHAYQSIEETRNEINKQIEEIYKQKKKET